MKSKEIKQIVKDGYTKIANSDVPRDCCNSKSCCGTAVSKKTISKGIGYSDKEINSVPDGANLGLGCGNPIALASLKKGEVVLDLGSGAGFDCFLASKKVGETDKVIGVDMTPEMIKKAKENARKGNYNNVEFKLGDIENMPVDDNSVDVIISNCVINLSPEKEKVFKEAFRVLKPNGRLMVSDIVLINKLPDCIKDSIEAYVGCLSGAIMKNKYIGAIKTAGFQDVRIIEETSFPIDYMANDPTAKALIKKSNIPTEKIKQTVNSVNSIKVYGLKPGNEIKNDMLRR
ncbi:MAG: arsenite methyltransferase [Planctomycetota bacterium]